MNAIEVLITEHQNIQRLNQVIRNACLQILEGRDVPVADCYHMINFIENYADKHHHGKEEQLLFHDMTDHLGKLAEHLITHGMLAEHNLARFYVSEWKSALERYEAANAPENRLDIITYASGYTKLLLRHIEKEDSVVYAFARRQLTPEILLSLDERTEEFEQKAYGSHIQDRYLGLLEELEKVYR